MTRASVIGAALASAGASAACSPFLTDPTVRAALSALIGALASLLTSIGLYYRARAMQLERLELARRDLDPPRDPDATNGKGRAAS